MKLVVFPEVSADWLRRIQAVSPGIQAVNCQTEEDAQSAIADADALFGTITPDLLRKAHRLRWVQAHLVGLEHYFFPDLVAHSVVVTNVRGIFSDLVPEHAIGLMLSLRRGLHLFARDQAAERWHRRKVAGLAGLTVGIIGLGGIGEGLARRAVAFEMRVVAIDPKAVQPATVETLYRPHDLARLLAESDFVVVCAPHTPDTERLIRRRELRQMRRTAYLVNVGRGPIVHLGDLTEALRAGEIAGAGLDVYDVEPLPPGHPLWRMENVVMTPHVAAEIPDLDERRLGVLLRNLGHFVRDEGLENVVDKTLWF